jgi:hypothetical protein
LLVITFLTLFLKVLNLQGKDASTPGGNWFQLFMVLFTKEIAALHSIKIILSFIFVSCSIVFWKIWYHTKLPCIMWV